MLIRFCFFCLFFFVYFRSCSVTPLCLISVCCSSFASCYCCCCCCCCLFCLINFIFLGCVFFFYSILPRCSLSLQFCFASAVVVHVAYLVLRHCIHQHLFPSFLFIFLFHLVPAVSPHLLFSVYVILFSVPSSCAL